MGYKRKLFNDKTVLVAAAAGVVAVSAILGTTLLSTNKKDNKGQSIVNLEEGTTTGNDYLVREEGTSDDLNLEAAENENAQYGYDFKMVNEATASSVRLGFLASNDWCTYVDNLSYNVSDDYDSRFSFLKGRYLEKGSDIAFSAENSKFTIYN